MKKVCWKVKSEMKVGTSTSHRIVTTICRDPSGRRPANRIRHSGSDSSGNALDKAQAGLSSFT